MKRRIKTVYISESDMLGMFREPLPITERKWFAGIPEDAKVLRCHADYLRNSIAFLVEHPSFEEIDDFIMPPEIGSQVITLKAAKRTDGGEA